MKHKKYILFVFIFLLIFILTGCWDKVEINDRAIAMAIGIDKKEDKISVTYAIPNLPVVTGQSSGDVKRFVKVSEGSSLLDANEKFKNISNKRLSYDHAKVIILGNEFLSDKNVMVSLMDYFNRSPEFALSLMIATTDKSAYSLINSNPNAQEVSGEFISGLYSKNLSKEQAENRTNLLDLLVELIDTNGNAKLPLIIFKDGEIQKAGLVILKDYTKHYTLTLEQTVPYNWARGKGKEVAKVVNIDNETISYEIDSLKRKVKFKKNKDGFDIDISIIMEGDVREYELLNEKNINDIEKINKIKKKLKEEFEKDINGIVNIIQADIGVDILDLSKSFKLQEGKLWEEYKDNWDVIFSSSNINVEVTPFIRRIGMSK